MKELIIGSRGSVLALWQAEHIKLRLKQELGLDSTIKIVKTKGDKILDVPLAKIGGKGLFTKELEELLLSGEIDLAVHSLKDVPVEFAKNLGLCAITSREDVRDCFLSEKFDSLDSLPKGAKVGTTSLRRSMQIKARRADLDTLSLRGNVQTRLEKLKKGDFDAIILAKAGVNRLGLSSSDVKHIVPLDFMVPAMGQGALGIESRLDSSFFDKIALLNDELSALCTGAEREFIKCLDGGCQVPIGVHGKLESGIFSLNAILGLPNGKEILAFEKKIEIQKLDSTKALNLARELANTFITNNAKRILAQAQEMAFK